jgi:2'-5' RNA ligase
MAFVGLKVPADTARLLASVDASERFGTPEPRDNYHVTILSLGDDLPIDILGKAVEPLVDVASRTKPFALQTSQITTFPPHPEKGTVPIIALIDSEPLMNLHGRLCKAFDKAGIPYSKKFPEYQPHVTLGYSKDPAVAEVVNVHIPTVSWGAGEVILWGGDKGDNRLILTAPFTLGVSAENKAMAKKASLAAYVKLSMLTNDGTAPAPPVDVRTLEQIFRPKRASLVEKVLLRYATNLATSSEPSNPILWRRAIEEAKARYKRYPSAHAHGFATRWYADNGGKWDKKS